ncbi:spore wall protein 2 isoform X2 [Drosophila hydei]|uniref:Spore wall protein 2 isoform X2 n=1 Tax=Drosophila hydei TaxID=7224 RepID=A0A6J2SQB5_DROHY|nr:spore wall protein 2 isoform X2 [Drosophila hydei]
MLLCYLWTVMLPLAVLGQTYYINFVFNNFRNPQQPNGNDESGTVEIGSSDNQQRIAKQAQTAPREETGTTKTTIITNGACKDEKCSNKKGSIETGCNEAGNSETGCNGKGSDGTCDNETGNGETGCDGTCDNETGNGETGCDGTGGDGTGDDGTGSDGTDSDGTGDDGTGDNGTGSDGTGGDETGDDGTASNEIGGDGTSDDGTGGNGTGNDGTGDDGTGDNGTGSDGTGGDETGDDGTASNETGGDGTGNDGTGDNGTGSDGTGGDETGDDGTASNETGGDETGDDGTASNESFGDGTDSNEADGNGTSDDGTGGNGTGSDGTGGDGTGSDGTGIDGTGDNGTGGDGTGDDGTGADGTGSNGTGDDGTGADGTGSNGTGDDGTGGDGTGSDGTGGDGTSDDGTGGDGTGDNGNATGGDNTTSTIPTPTTADWLKPTPHPPKFFDYPEAECKEDMQLHEVFGITLARDRGLPVKILCEFHNSWGGPWLLMNRMELPTRLHFRHWIFGYLTEDYKDLNINFLSLAHIINTMRLAMLIIGQNNNKQPVYNLYDDVVISGFNDLFMLRKAHLVEANTSDLLYFSVGEVIVLDSGRNRSCPFRVLGGWWGAKIESSSNAPCVFPVDRDVKQPGYVAIFIKPNPFKVNNTAFYQTEITTRRPWAATVDLELMQQANNNISVYEKLKLAKFLLNKKLVKEESERRARIYESKLFGQPTGMQLRTLTTTDPHMTKT